jgi:hypothetical protein
MEQLIRPAFQRSALGVLCKTSSFGLALLLLAGLTGCGAGSPALTSTNSFSVTGHVHGGQNPVSGSLVQLWATGTTATGTASAVPAQQLVASGSYYLGGTSGCTASASQTCYNGVYTDSTGGFTLNNDYKCPSSTAEVYITVQGGNPGLAPGTANNALLMLDPLGPCGNLSSSTNVFIDEVTTVATAWALAPFLDANGNINSSPTNVTGLGNAFLNAQLLADPGTGMASTSVPSNVTIETGKLYALANSMASCVNSDGSTGCQPFFAAATPPVGSQPANTLAAALNVVRNPGYKVADVFYAAAPQPPFSTTLTAPPSDWTMSAIITGGGINYPSALDVDGYGNVWVANYFGVLSAFSPQGTPLSANGFPISGNDEVYGLTIDTSNNIWVTNEQQPYHSGGSGSITHFYGAGAGAAMGTLVNGTQFLYGNDTDFPLAMSADSNGNVLVANYADSTASVFSSGGTEIGAYIGSNGNSAFPVSVTADPSHGYWLANQGDNTVSHFDSNGNLLARVACCDGANGVATDAFGNAWVANYYGKSVSEVSNANALVIVGDSQGGITYPSSVTIDAAQNVWVANFRGASFSEIAGNANTLAAGTGISPTTGYGQDALLVDPFGIAVDASGNLWLSSFNGNSLTMFMGVAAPTATPTLPVPTAP